MQYTPVTMTFKITELAQQGGATGDSHHIIWVMLNYAGEYGEYCDAEDA